MDESKENKQFDLIKWISNSCSVSFKIFLIITLTLIMLVPKGMVEELVMERMSRSTEVISEISSKRGGIQKVDGPVLSIPLKNRVDARTYVHVIPEQLNIDSNVDPEIRKRGIFEAVVYSSDISINARFKVPGAEGIGLTQSSFDLDNAVLSFGLSDPGGIAGTVSVESDGKELNTVPGINVPLYIDRGFHVPLKINSVEGVIAVNTTIKLNGSQELHFVPLGRSTSIKVKSSWKDPSFTGEFLTSKYNPGDNGFDASWDIHELQSNIKPIWYDEETGSRNPSIGVKLIQVNDPYQRVLRVIKYAILFISFTFAAVFISERVTGISIHPIQYLLTGAASLFFYVFLLSLSEHMNFNPAYGVTSLVVTMLIAGYAKAIFRSMKMAYTMGGITSLLYLFLFGTLQMEDYALLMGSSGLLFILAIVMYLTRGINKDENLVCA